MLRTEKEEDSCCWDKIFQPVTEQMKDGNEEVRAMRKSYAKKKWGKFETKTKKTT